MSAHVEEVEKTLSKVQVIREAISDLAQSSLLRSFGLGLEEEAKSSSSDSEEEGATDNSEGSQTKTTSS